MAVYKSVGVYNLESDISNFVNPLGTATAALVGYSAKGPVDTVVLVTSPQQFVSEFGTPDPTTGHYFHYSALAYLERGSQLYCLRVTNGALFGGANIMVTTSGRPNAGFTTGQSTSEFTAPSGYISDILFQVMGTDPGIWNNKVGVIVTNIQDDTAEEETDQYTFDVNVYAQDTDGNWSQVESFTVSRKQKLDGNGRQLYLENVINGASNYITVANNVALADTALPKPQAARLAFLYGNDGAPISASDVALGWAEFADPEKVAVQILINGGETSQTVQLAMKTIVDSRKDCVMIPDIDIDSLNSVQDAIDWRMDVQGFNDSYSMVYAPWVLVQDNYNDKQVGVPSSGYVAAAMAYNDSIGNVWDAPAGEERGMLNVLDVYPSNMVFNKGDRDAFADAQINPIQKFQGRGIMIYDQLTQQRKSSALSFINVRRELIAIERDCAVALRAFLLGANGNTELTRFRVTATLNSYFDDLSARGAFQTEGGDKGYQVNCNDLNNPGAVIDRAELHVDIFIKPVRVIRVIQLRAIITTTSVSFEELMAKGIAF